MARAVLAIVSVSLLAAACSSSSPTAPTDGPTMTSLSPSSGPVGSQVTIYGSGFEAIGNTVNFSPDAMQPGVIPDISSPSSTTVVFSVPSIWRPACSYLAEPCPIASIPTVPGTYNVWVTNSLGSSKAISFTVIAGGS